jgi:nicotinamidase-related amidase
MMTTALDPETTALLVMDVQPLFLTQCADSARLIANINRLTAQARSAGTASTFVRVAFRPGYPELSDASPLAEVVKTAGVLVEGGNDTELDPRIDRGVGDLVVTKHRTSAFSGSDLEMILRATGVRTLVLSGFSTAGVILSTVDAAFDLDYRVVVAADCCADPDFDVHDVLIRKVLPRRATVAGADEIQWI